MTNIQKFSGIASWAKVRAGQQDKKYDIWSINLSLDDKSFARFKDEEINLGVKESEYGKNTVRFKRGITEKDWDTDETKDAEPPTVYLKDDQSGEYVKWPEGLIGNGSVVTVAVEVWKGDHGGGSRLMRVFVDKLVVYEPKKEPDPDEVNLPF